MKAGVEKTGLRHLLVDRRYHGHDLGEMGKHRGNRAHDCIGAIHVLGVCLPERIGNPMTRVVIAAMRISMFSKSVSNSAPVLAPRYTMQVNDHLQPM